MKKMRKDKKLANREINEEDMKMRDRDRERWMRERGEYNLTLL